MKLQVNFKEGKYSEEFRENRALWMKQSNDRGVLTLRLKQLLNTETKTNLIHQKIGLFKDADYRQIYDQSFKS
jgi:hypothetical protein